MVEKVLLRLFTITFNNEQVESKVWPNNEDSESNNQKGALLLAANFDSSYSASKVIWIYLIKNVKVGFPTTLYFE